ncbi:MAG: ATP-binding protein [Woeseia sp.]
MNRAVKAEESVAHSSTGNMPYDRESILDLVLCETRTATFAWDLRSNEMVWDDGFRQLFGFREGVCSGTLEDLTRSFHPDDADMAIAAADASRVACGSLHVEHRIIRNDGEVRWLTVRGLTICADDGTPERLVGVCWDETDARSAADRIELLGRMHEENPQPVFRVMKDGTIREGNQASTRLLEGLCVHPASETARDFMALVSRVQLSGRNRVSDIEIADRVYQVNLVPLPEHDYVNVYATDVTMLRRSQQMMQQAAKMEAIGQLAGSVAHDFNNRLTVILGNLELLGEEIDAGSDAAELLADARHAAENSTELAKRLLSVSSPQTGERTVTDINSAISRMESLLEKCLGESVGLSVVLNADLPQAEMHRAGFEDVLVNLTLNARDAMSPGDTLTIETTSAWLDNEYTSENPDLIPGAYTMVAVTDTGKGMTAEIRERAFEPFYTTKEAKGTGLGLSTVYNFVKQCGGHVSIYSEVGVGTCVKLYLPTPGADRAAEIASPGARDGELSGRKILLVEDQADIRDVTSRILSDLGCDVRTVAGSNSALDYLKGGSELDMLVTDLVLPGDCDGVGLVAAARKQRPHLKVLVTSGYTSSGPHGRLLSGVENYDFLSKPYTRESLAAAMRRAFMATGADRAA